MMNPILRNTFRGFPCDEHSGEFATCLSLSQPVVEAEAFSKVAVGVFYGSVAFAATLYEVVEVRVPGASAFPH